MVYVIYFYSRSMSVCNECKERDKAEPVSQRAAVKTILQLQM